MKKYVKNESGAVVLEGMLVVVITLLMLVWILSIGFLYYQKYTVRIVTNDVAEKIAATYKLTATDIITGYISRNEVTKKTVYSGTSTHDVNENRCQSYVNYMLDKTNFFNTVKDAQVSVHNHTDSLGRSHVEVTMLCTFNTPFGEGLELFGMSGTNTYTVTAYADSTDLSQYVSAVTTADAFTNGSIIRTPSIISSTLNMINSLYKMITQLKK